MLIGRGIEYLPYFVLAFSRLGERGLGADGGRFVLAEVHAEGRNASRPLYTSAEGILHQGEERITAADLGDAPTGPRLTVEFLTPTRIRNEGAVRREVAFVDLVRALLRRVSSLCYFHCGGELQVDFRGLVEEASRVRTVRSELRWCDQGRFSGRQRRHIEMGGVVGTVTFEAGTETLRLFGPLVAAGEWVHVGKGAVMGLGKYRVE